MKKTIKWLGVIVLITVAGFFTVACDNNTPEGDDDTIAITYTAAANNSTDTTAINLTFSGAVTGLLAGDITINNGTGNVTKGTLTGSGTSWAIAVTVNTAGNVTVSINKTGIESAGKTVAVAKSSGGDVNLVGTVWLNPTVYPGGLNIQFTSATEWKQVAVSPGTEFANGTYTVSGNTVTVTVLNQWNGSTLIPVNQTSQGTISGSQLSLNNNGTIVIFTKQQ